jgi:hypothetical protein
MPSRIEPLADLPERKSASADAARRAEAERVLALTPLERAKLALRLGHRMRVISEHVTRER